MAGIHIPVPEKNWILDRYEEKIELSARTWVSTLPTVVLQYQDKFGKSFLVVRNIGAGPKYNVLEPLNPEDIARAIYRLTPGSTLIGYFPVNGLHLSPIHPNSKIRSSNMNIHGRRYQPQWSSFENQIYWIPMETR